MYSKLKKEMTTYYRKMDRVDGLELFNKVESEKFNLKRKAIFDKMNEFYKENPNVSICLLKSKIHTLMAESFDPVIFKENPFYFEMGLNHSRSWGLGTVMPSSWLESVRNAELKSKHGDYLEAENYFSDVFGDATDLCSIYPGFDTDHHTIGYTKLFKVGIKGILEETNERKLLVKEGSKEHDFYTAVIESLTALITIAGKFSIKAKELLKTCNDETQRRNLERIEKTAKIIPYNPPTTFYEGLAMLIFTRETFAVLENMGISQLGHVDRLLGNLFQKDIKSGEITEEEARILISKWMMHTDIKFDLENNKWPETSTCIQLGGCDENGDVVFNKVTELFIEEHQKHKLVNPKLNCRYSINSPDYYLEIIGKAIISGNNTFALINDDVIINGLVSSGVEEKDARLYVNGGCQETMIEGFGHTEGAGVYLSLLRVFDLFLRKDKDIDVLNPINDADTFNEFYDKFILEFKTLFTFIATQRNFRQSYYKRAISYPLFSSTQEGCLVNGKDYVEGSAKYNFSTVALVGFANVVDSLYAIKTLVYDQKRLTLKEFLTVLEKDWKGYEKFNQEVKNLPKYGHNVKDVDLLANGFLKDLSKIIKGVKNERGGIYLPSTFVYKYNKGFAYMLRATPDGRKDYEYMAASCSPSTLQPIKDITEPIKSMQTVDYTVCGGGISVLDVMLPVSRGMTEKTFSALMRVCSKCKCATVQPNVLRKEELQDAKLHPEKHKDLIVRVCGLSAYFVALNEKDQDEIINRNFYEY